MSMNSRSGPQLLSYLPWYYTNSTVMRSILDSQGLEIDMLRQALDEALEQYYVSTATWGLDTWEDELDLSREYALPLSERRSRIISKLRGTGTANLHVVKNTAESYDNGTIDIIEDHNSYTIYVKFVNTGGIPANLPALESSLRALVPAHLDIQYKFKYLLWSELDSLNLTWEEIDALNMSWSEWEVYVCMQWDELDNLNITWNQLDSISLTWNEWESYI